MSSFPWFMIVIISITKLAAVGIHSNYSIAAIDIVQTSTNQGSLILGKQISVSVQGPAITDFPFQKVQDETSGGEST